MSAERVLELAKKSAKRLAKGKAYDWVDDIAQEAAISFLRKRYDQLLKQDDWEKLIWKMAKNAMVDQYRKQRHEPLTIDAEQVEQPVQNGTRYCDGLRPEDFLTDEQYRYLVDKQGHYDLTLRPSNRKKKIAALLDAIAAIKLLAKGETRKDIAELFGISEDTLRKRLKMIADQDSPASQLVRKPAETP